MKNSFLQLTRLKCLVLLLSAAGYSANAQSITQYITNGNQSVLLQEQAGKPSFSTGSNGNSSITVDPSTTFQAIDGFGYTLTQGSAYVLMTEVSAAQRQALLTEIFDPAPGIAPGLGINFLRIAIGASDLSPYPYTYNDLPAGQTDVSQSQFSLAGPDLEYVIPVLQEILAINPDLKIKAVPWSAPAWMKTNGALSNGHLKPEYYASYATYFVKYLQAMQTQGIPIYAVAPQNEPDHCCNNPAMLMTAQEQIDFIMQLGPAIQNAGFATKILTWDHNCDIPEYPMEVLGSAAGQYVDGAAFHLYAGDISALSTVHDAFPDKNIYFTEQYTGAGGSFLGDLAWHMKNVMFGATNNWAKAVLEWNLAADADEGPHTDGGCTNCLGALTLDGGTVTRNVAWYIIAHMSKFVRPGAVRISTGATGGLTCAGFVNTSAHGSTRVLVVHNDNNQPGTTFNIQYQGKIATVTLPKKSVGTYIWSDTGGNSTPTDIHVQSVTTSTQGAGQGSKYGTATVTVFDDLGNPVSGVSVSGTFSGTFSENVSGITNASGSVTLITSSTAKGGVTVNFCVGNMTHATLSYDAQQNVVTCNTGSRLGLESGLNDIHQGVCIYPNPVTDRWLNIELDAAEYAVQASLSDLTGRAIWSAMLKSGINDVHLPFDLEEGIYLICISGKEFNMERKILLQ